MKDEDLNRNTGTDDPWASQNLTYPHEKAEDMKLWGVFIFGLIGATATTFAVSHLRRTVDFLFAEFSRSGKGGMGSSFRSTFQEGARKRYNQRRQEEYEEEMETVGLPVNEFVLSDVSSIFPAVSSNSLLGLSNSRERNKKKKIYESWRENDSGAYHHHFQREDWYWKTDTFYKGRRANYWESSREGVDGSHSLSHHYSILGLDRFRQTPSTDAEIKTAFRAKAMEFHPDQNQENKEAAEVKFKEVMVSYEAIKKERDTKNL